MEYPFETYGRITFDPKRGSMKTRVNWWCVIELDDDQIANYYRWFVDREWWDADHSSIKRVYNRPTHRSHVSLIRGEKPRKNIQDWGEYMADQKILFRYSPMVYQSRNAYYSGAPDQFWCIDVEWEPYAEFRKHFGLPWNHNGKPFRGHMTVVRVY